MRSQTKWWQILFLALVFLGYASWSWRKGADLLVDFGTQLYIPWQIVSGKVLYRDIAYLPGGPFSQLFNAAAFKVFGTSLTTLMLVNLVIFAALLVAIFRFFEKIADGICATAICFVLITIFGFSALLPGGNYNYVTPYSHETYHGLVLSAFAVILLSHWVLSRRALFVFGAGFCIGLVFLTKPDIFVAILATAIVAFVFAWRECANRSGWMKSLAWCVAAMLVPLTIVFFYFQRYQPVSEALQSLAWAWIPLLTTEAAQNKYYTWVLGLDHPVGNVFIAFMQMVSLSIALALCAWCARSENRTIRRQILAGIILIILATIVWRGELREGGRLLFFLGPVLAAILIWQWWKSQEKSSSLIPAILWSVFAVGMMAKMGFFSKIWHYGTFLGMPVVVLGIYFAFGFLPGCLSKWQVNPRHLRVIFTVFLMIIVAKVWYVSNQTYVDRTLFAGVGPDRIRFDLKYRNPTGTLMAEGLDWIEKNTPADATIAVVPHGVMLNYLSRRTNPTPYITFILPEWQAFKEENILKAYDANRPDYIIITRFDSAGGFEYGVSEFGESSEYGLKTMQWIRSHYEEVQLIRYRKRDPFGMDILKLKSSP